MIDLAGEPRNCPVCGSGDRTRVFAEASYDPARVDTLSFSSRKTPEFMHPRYIECPGCELLYADLVPECEGLTRLYQAAAYDGVAESRYAAATYARFLPALVGRLPDRLGALDIGTGDGAFLEELLAAGFTGVQGVEPSAAPVAAAQSQTRTLIRQGPFRRSDFPDGEFSLVSCFQTLEHVLEPRALCRDAFALLKAGGAALFVCHDRRALSARLMGMRSPIFDIEHLQLFSPASAERLLRDAGFVDVRVESMLNRYPLHYWMKLLPLPAGLKTLLIRLFKTLRLGYLPVSLPAGNIVVVGWRAQARSCSAERRRDSL